MKRIGFALLFLSSIVFAQTGSTPKLWSETNSAFYDNNGNGNLDINDFVTIRARRLGSLSLPLNTEYFIHLPNMGHMMTAFIDQTTYRSFCPNKTHYTGMNPLLKAIGQTMR